MDSPLSSENQIVAALRRIIREVDLHSRRLVEEHGLTGPQLATLREVAACGRISVTALARAVHLSQPTVTGIVDRLERRGLVQRCRDGMDRRTVNIEASPEGRAVLDRAPSLLRDRFRQKLAGLQEWERTMILATLQRIAEMMEVQTIDAAPMLIAGPVDGDTEAHTGADEDVNPHTIEVKPWN